MREIGNRPLEELLRVVPARLREHIREAGTEELEEVRVRAGRSMQSGNGCFHLLRMSVSAGCSLRACANIPLMRVSRSFGKGF